MLRRIFKKEEGQSLTDNVILLATIAIVVLCVLSLLATKVCPPNDGSCRP